MTDEHESDLSLLQAALDAATRGWPVFPCDPRTKAPIVEHGLHAATTDAKIIEEWWTKWPAAMIGMRTGAQSGLWVLDVDCDAAKGADGFASIAQLEQRYGKLPDTMISITPRGGSHLFYRWHDGVANSAGKLGLHLDVRGEGGYVILPPSERADRKRYVWREDCPPDVADAPPWLLELVMRTTEPVVPPHSADLDHTNRGSAYARAALEEECAAVAAAASGRRNETLNRASFNLHQLVASGVLPEVEVQDRLFGAATACGLVHDDGDETVRATIGSGAKAGLQKPRAILARQTSRISNATGTQTSRYALLPFSALKPQTEPNYLVKGIVPRVGFIPFWGPPKCGKSFLAFDMAMHVALGWDYRGRKVKQGPVAYCAFEGAAGFHNRAEAFRRAHPDTPADVAFYLMPTRLDLVRDHQALIASLREQCTGAVLVVLDTLNRSLAGSESKDVDMGAYLAAADAIRATFDCAVIVVHHCGINDTRPRGHTSLTGAADAQLAVMRDDANNVVLQVEFMKDGPEGETLVSRLETVEVGIDADGDPITSCIIRPVDGSSVPEPKRAKLPQAATAGLRVLYECLADRGRAAPISDDHIPNGVKVVTMMEWRDYLFRANAIDREGSYRQEFKRIHMKLKLAGRIGIWDEHVWAVM